jgi:hypothetical protein
MDRFLFPPRFVALAVLCTVAAHGAAPNLQSLRPLGLAPGAATRLTVRGEQLAGAEDLWTSFPAKVTREENETGAVFEVVVDRAVGAGLGAVRFIGTNGISNPQLLLLDPMSAITGSGTNRTPGSAQILSWPGAVDSVCEEVRSDYYRFTAKKGQRLSLEVVAQRLASAMDPYLRVLDLDHRELAATDDTPGLGADARLDFKCPRTGDYLVEVRDTRYGGGARYRYRLRLGEPLPAPLPFVLADGLSARTRELAPPTQVAEKEPNDGPARVQAVTWPALIAGSFQKPKDRDAYEILAGKGDTLLVSGHTRSLGWPCDLFLQLQTTNGTKLAEANATGADEGFLTNRFTEAGPCRLIVEELNGRGGPDLRYELRLEKARPGFTLDVAVERVSLPPGDSFEIEVHAERQGYKGDIALSALGLPAGCTLSNAVIAEGTNAAKLKIAVPGTLAMGEHFDVTLQGTANVDGREVVAPVSTLPALRTVFPELRYPPRQLDGLLAVSIAGSSSSTPAPTTKKKKK